MKRYILILASILVCWSASAQSIDKNEINEHGTRIISTHVSMAYEDDMSIGFSLEYHKNGDIENYYILLLVPKAGKYDTIEKDQQIIFKTVDDAKEIGLAVQDFRSRYVNGWSTAAMFVISPKTAELLSQKLSKIRINYTTPEKESFFDIDTSSGELCSRFAKAYKNINKAKARPADKDRSQF